MPRCADTAKQKKIKDDMDLSVSLLLATGLCEWELDDWWLPPPGTVPGNDDDAGSGGEANGPSNDDVNSGQDEEGDGEQLESPPQIPSFVKTDYVFFFAHDAPFLVGQVLATRRTDDDDDQNDDGEVEVHWLSPSNSRVRDNASKYTIAEYGKGVFAKDFKEEAVLEGRKRKRKLMPDVDWMPREEVVASCPSLNAAKYIPKAVLNALAEARHHEHVEDEEDEEEGDEEEVARTEGGEEGGEDANAQGIEEEEQHEEEEKEGGDDSREERGAGVSTDAGRSIGAPVQQGAGEAAVEADTGSTRGAVQERPQPTTQPPEPHPRVRLTAAHFRSRRGSSGP